MIISGNKKDQILQTTLRLITERGFHDTPKSLVNSVKMPSSVEVARYGYKAMLQGKVVAIHDKANSVMAKTVGLLPRNMVTGLVRLLQAKKA